MGNMGRIGKTGKMGIPGRGVGWWVGGWVGGAIRDVGEASDEREEF